MESIKHPDGWYYLKTPCQCSCHTGKKSMHVTACCDNGFKLQRVGRWKPEESDNISYVHFDGTNMKYTEDGFADFGVIKKM